MTDHPLTETAAVELWEERCGYRFTDNTLAALRAAFDAGREHEREHVRPAEVTEEMRRAAASAYEDMAQVTRPENHERCLDAALEAALDAADGDRPWEPLNGGPVYVGDEVRQELNGVTTIAVVGRVDGEGDPWTTEDRFIGVLDEGTWYVRRAVQELPTEDGAVIVPAEGREFIETRSGKKSRRLTWDAESYVWYDARGTHLDADIITGTWKVDGK